jgi:hypothetical protein
MAASATRAPARTLTRYRRRVPIAVDDSRKFPATVTAKKMSRRLRTGAAMNPAVVSTRASVIL